MHCTEVQRYAQATSTGLWTASPPPVLAEGLRESTESWAGLLRDCRRRGMKDPVLVAGDGAMGLWNALAEVFPEARHQRCWVHKVRTVMNALPKSAQPGAKRAMQEIYDAEDRDHAAKAVKDFAEDYGAKLPKAVQWIQCSAPRIPSSRPFSTVKLRTRVTRDAGSTATALAIVFKLAEPAQECWRAITAPHLVALVRAGARFASGVLVEREPATAA